MSLKIIDLTKQYKKRKKYHPAVNNVSLHIDAGEICSVIGQNGAGKTTIIKCILHFIKPTEGEISFDGKTLIELMDDNLVSYLPENLDFPGLISLSDYLYDLCKIKGMKIKVTNDRIHQLLNHFDLSEFADQPIATFSKGMKKKVGFIQSVMNEPKLLILDEPTDGLDPVSRRKLLQTIKGIANSGCAVLITSHILSDLEMICDRVYVLHEGVLLQEIDMKESQLSEECSFEATVKYQAQGEKETVVLHKGDELAGLSFFKVDECHYKKESLEDIYFSILKEKL